MEAELPGDPKEARAHAANCMQLAETASSPTLQKTFADLAKQWNRLAKELEQVRHFPILSGFPNHANSASPLLIVRWGEDHGTSVQPGFA